MPNNKKTMVEFQLIQQLIKHYFDGLHFGDVDTLDQIFHDDVVLKSPNQRRTKKQWLDAVAQRPIPEESGYGYEYKILSIDIIQDQAMVKVACPLFEFNYVDYLGLLKENGQWSIVSKMYTNVKNTKNRG